MKHSQTVVLWICAALLASYFVVPFLANRLHMIMPVYGPLVQANIDRKGDIVFLSGIVEKSDDCEVLRSEALSARISWHDTVGRNYRFAALQRPQSGNNVQGRPLYRKGDQIPVGPFFVDLPDDAAQLGRELIIELPCVRWQFFNVVAEIGPFEIPRFKRLEAPQPSEEFLLRQQLLDDDLLK